MTTLSKEQVKKVTGFLTTLIRLSVKATIEEQRFFSVENERYICSDDEEEAGYPVGKTDRFSDQVENRYQIQITYCEQSETYASEHEIEFEMTGELQAIFEENGIEPKFVVWLDNQDGEPFQSYSDAKEFADGLYFPRYKSLEEADLEDFDAFFEAITKPYLFEILGM